jgi:hypothetical protein
MPLSRPSAYYMAQTLASSPFNITSGLVLFLVMYGMVGLRYEASVIWITVAAIALYALVSIQVQSTPSHLLTNSSSGPQRGRDGIFRCYAPPPLSLHSLCLHLVYSFDTTHTHARTHPRLHACAHLLSLSCLASCTSVRPHDVPLGSLQSNTQLYHGHQIRQG